MYEDIWLRKIQMHMADHKNAQKHLSKAHISHKKKKIHPHINVNTDPTWPTNTTIPARKHVKQKSITSCECRSVTMQHLIGILKLDVHDQSSYIYFKNLPLPVLKPSTGPTFFLHLALKMNSLPFFSPHLHIHSNNK